MKKNVWIMNHYAGNMFFDKGGRHYWFAKYLKKAGYQPVIFCANSKHNSKEELYYNDIALWKECLAEEIHTPFIFVKARTYSGNGKQRVLNMLDFYFNVKKVVKEYARKYGRPDIIYASSVHPLTLVAGIQLAKYFRVKCICEVRDLWPLSLVEFGYLKENSIITKLLYQGEKWIYKKADKIIFTMKGGNQYIRDRGWINEIVKDNKIHQINNGVDLTDFDKNIRNNIYNDRDLDNFETFKIVYTGSIRRANKIGNILDIAKLVNDKKIVFLLWGAGDDLDYLKQRVIQENITNVMFKGKVDKKCIPTIISKADLNIMHYDFLPIFRYGTSANKLFEYMAAGKPILVDFPCDYNPAIEEGAAIYIGEFNCKFIAEKIKEIALLDKDSYNKFCYNARRGILKYDFKKLTNDLIIIIESC